MVMQDYVGLSPDRDSNQGALNGPCQKAGVSYFVFVDGRINNIEPDDQFVLSAINGSCATLL